MLPRFIMTYIILYIIIILICIVSFIATNYNNTKYIYLERCERLAENSVIFGKNKPYYLTYEDCNKPPRRLKIENYIFMER